MIEQTHERKAASIKYSGNKNYKNHVAKHPNCTFVSLVDFVGRASIQEALLAIEVEESTIVGVTNNTTAVIPAAKTSTSKDSGHGEHDAQNDKEDRVAAKEGPCGEEEGFESADGGFR